MIGLIAGTTLSMFVVLYEILKDIFSDNRSVVSAIYFCF
jgi:hypothetical protein